jgi:DNA helicase-2/ATP-dependent DNA helicase PcrA
MKKTLVLGGPGAGKTTRLLSVVEDALNRGIAPSEIAFCSFTNAAADEARDRAITRFGLSKADFPYFRTLHSLSFKELGLRHTDVFGKEGLDELAEVTGELCDPRWDSTGGPAMGPSADPLLTIDQYARTTRKTLREAWEDHGAKLDWFRLKRFVDAYTFYRNDRGLLDFTDMLERYAQDPMPPTPVRVAILDEVQDLTLLQWIVADRAFADAEELWAGGDDDQSLYRWAGAAEDHLLSLQYVREVLPLSHRLPQEIFDFSRNIVNQIERRYAKDTRSSGRQGAVNWIAQTEEVDLTQGSWLLLARTKTQLEPMEAEARAQGVIYSMKGKSSVDPRHVRAVQAYEALRRGARIEGDDAMLVLLALGIKNDGQQKAGQQIDETRTYDAAELGLMPSAIWHDALIRIPLDDREYYLSCLRRGAKLTEAPRVRISTIHGAKGAEAEHVLLSTDMNYRVQKGFEAEPDSEHRVWYVGATRAAVSLNLLAPKGVYGYRM